MKHTTSLRRFAGKAIDTSRVAGLRHDHPALQEARTIFPKSVVHPEDSERLLVSGHNNPKLGNRISKGPKAGFPLYHLTLEERATCPKSCHMWRTCYGNAMPYARRHDASDILDLACVLDDELAALQVRFPSGFMVRLHTLGDFPSVEYVRLWAHFLEEYPALNVFGYTSNWYFAKDPKEREIGQAILALTNAQWDRFAIRFSTEASTEQTAIVVDEVDSRANVLMCPAQTKDTECCATCGLCWAPALRTRSIGFLKHGMKMRGPSGPRGRVRHGA